MHPMDDHAKGFDKTFLKYDTYPPINQPIIYTNPDSIKNQLPKNNYTVLFNTVLQMKETLIMSFNWILI